MPLVLCPMCGHKVSSAAPSCPQCGHPIAEPRVAMSSAGAPAPRRGVAVFLALVIGGLGAHKFYMGKPGQGLLYLLFCWTFIPLIVSLVEGIIYLATSDEDWNQRFAAHV